MIYLEGRQEKPLYRLESPWVLECPTPSSDTTQPIASLTLEDLRITIHNFPFNSYEQSIPPQAQIQRWIRQLGEKEYLVTPTSHSGFVGFILESEEMLAAAFQLSPHYRNRLPPSELCADWTLKATGNIHKYRAEILQLIETLEPIDSWP